MHQPVPDVSRADVERIVRREFSGDADGALAILDEYHSDAGDSSRVQLAVLKLAAGDIAVLRREIERAKYDFRDILVVAEYPADWEARWRIDVSPDEQQRIYEQDWQQYQSWFRR